MGVGVDFDRNDKMKETARVRTSRCVDSGTVRCREMYKRKKARTGAYQ